MPDSHLNLLLHGSPSPLPEQIPLRAGPLTVILEAGDLRCISYHGRELVRRIYGTVRDRDWVTIAGRLSEVTVSRSHDRFHVSYVSDHRQDAIEFAWRASIDGAPDGTISFAFAGEARSTFERNRIGLCVLHPIRWCAGRGARARLTDGAEREVVFPELVAVEQPVDGFMDLAGLSYDAGEEARIEVTFEGDTFETEDQRNWIDHSYKTYGTRLDLPRPVVVPKGTRIDQRVTIRLHAPPPAAPASPRQRAAGDPGIRIDFPMPRVGVRIGSYGGDVAAQAVTLLQEVRPAHVRVDLALSSAGWERRLESALLVQRQIGCELELAIHAGPHAGAAVDALATLLPRPAGLARLLVFDEDQPATSHEALERVHARLLSVRPDIAPVGTGSSLDLYQLHQLPIPSADLLCWPMNPHAHASDVTSLAETPPAAGDQVRSVRARHPGVAVAITPITLDPRLPPGAPAIREPHPLHASLFGAAWTLAIASQIARAGASSATFFRDARDLGGSRAHPLFHVLADLGECADGSVVADDDRDAGAGVESLLVRRPSGATLLLSNLTRHSRTVPLPRGLVARTLRVLDRSTAQRATADRETFRGDTRSVDGAKTVDLDAFATARLDGELAGLDASTHPI